MARKSILGRFPMQPTPTKDGSKQAPTPASIIKPLELSVSGSNKVINKAIFAKGIVTQSTATSGSGKSRKRLSPTDLETLSARQRGRLIKEQHKAFLTHPYTAKLELAKSKLLKVMGTIFSLANNDLIVCDFDTGLNDYSKNLKFAEDLDSLSKELIVLSKDCTEKANTIRE